MATVARLENEIANYGYDAIWHVGDFAYDLYNEQGQRGDNFLRSIEPIAARTPYMVCQGNHETKNNLLHYYNRFTMPGNNNNLWYSFNHGKAHVLAYSSELIFINFTEMIWLSSTFNVKFQY